MPADREKLGEFLPKPAQFLTTHWSVVLAAGQAHSPEAVNALEQLCCNYWYPLYLYVRRSGRTPDDAQDLTQAFLASLLEHDLFRRASANRGRFRSFLLSSLRNFLCDENDRREALKRGGGNTPVSLDAMEAEERYAAEPVDPISPDLLFDRRWAMTLLERAQTRLEEEYDRAGKLELYRELKGFDAAEGCVVSYAESASALDIPENTLKSAVHRMRLRYRELVREEIAHTVESPLEVDEEIQYLLALFGS